VPSFVSNVGY